MIQINQRRHVWKLLIGLLLAGTAAAQEIITTPAKPTGVYGVGEQIEWKVEAKGGREAGRLHD